MLTINGDTFGKVFANLASHPQLDAREQAAARRIADWFQAVEAQDDAITEATAANDRDACDRAEDERFRLMGARPFFGNPYADTCQEWRSVIFGDIKFTIWPYTTGATMNVGVDHIDRSGPRPGPAAGRS